jgi:hypothetical protein
VDVAREGEDVDEDAAGEPEKTDEPRPDPAHDPEAEHDLVMAAARRIIATDAAIIHRLGTV